MMEKTPEQLKHIIEDYIISTGVNYQNSTVEVQKIYPDVQWQFLIDSALHVTKLKSRDDRINFHYVIEISQQHQEDFEKIMNTEPEFVNSLNELIILKDCFPRWVEESNGIKEFEISTYIDIDELNRPNFYKTWDRVTLLANHLAQKIQIKINPKSAKPTDSDSSTMSMYR